MPFLIAAVVVKIAVFFAFGQYQRVWRYAGFWDLMAVVLANSAASIVLTALMVGSRLLGWIPGLSRSVPPLDWLFTLALTVGLRASLRAIAETVSRRPRDASRPNRRVLIVGAGDAGALVAREMQKNPHLGLRPIGFLDDDRIKSNKRIYGLPVLGNIGALAKVAETQRVDEVVIAMPTAGGPAVRAAVERCQLLRIPSRVMPGVYELLDGQLSVSRLRSVDIADLLRRPQVHSGSSSSSYLKGACVAVTGAGGSIGSELCRQIQRFGPAELIMLDRDESALHAVQLSIKGRALLDSPDVVLGDIRDIQFVT
ncbi:MAG: polysaccharide biosynthesis protein, partial [Acidobacteriota bacterium]|nr:polysaccharide biosynthesis protein [Acidobacteriota bacterium]